MSFRFLKVLVLTSLLSSCFAFAQPRQLRICADPANPPFSSVSRNGFENRLADLLARDLHECRKCPAQLP